MASLLNGSYGSLNNKSLLNEGFGPLLITTASGIECVATVNAQLAQSSILEATGFAKTIKVTTNKKQILVKGI